MTRASVLVTGADGFIGSHLVEALVRAGQSVRAMVQYNSFDSRGWLDHVAPEILDAVEVVAADIRDPFSVKAAMQGCDTVFHLAALIAIPYSYRSPASYVATNVAGTLNVIQAARDLDLSRVIHTSTSEVYGTARFTPITEDHPLQAQSPYAASKIGADQIALSFYRSFGTPVAVIRPFNTYGPRQSTRAVIPTIITQLAAGHTTLHLGALRPTRDFNYIADTVAGFLAVAAADAAIGEVINIGSGFEISIGELARTIARLMGREVTITTDEDRLRPEKSEVERLLAANGKARRLTGWRPAYAGREGLEQGLRETIAWFTQPENLARYRPGTYTL